jgi:hypothetical protein
MSSKTESKVVEPIPKQKGLSVSDIYLVIYNLASAIGYNSVQPYCFKIIKLINIYFFNSKLAAHSDHHTEHAAHVEDHRRHHGEP